MMKIRGSYFTDDNYTWLCVENTVYTIASDGNWGSVKVGQKTFMGNTLTQNAYANLCAKYNKVGTFTLS